MAAASPVPAPETPIAATPPPAPAADTSPKKSYFKAAAALISSSLSFKEESNLVADLEDPEKKALDDLKLLLLAAISSGDFSPPPPVAADPPPPPAKSDSDPPAEEAPAEKPADDDGAKTVEAIASTVVTAAADADASTVVTATADAAPAASAAVSIWGIPLIGDARSDTVLLKFLRARDFKPAATLAMVKSAVAWAREFKIDALLDEDLGVPEFGKAVFMHGVDREGHPVCYNVYGEFQDKELQAMAFGDAEKREKFLRWRIQYLEKGVRDLLDLSPGGVSTMVQVTDFANSPGLLKRELGQALQLLQDNYPEFVAKQLFINAPWWYLAFSRVISPFLTARTKSKFIVAGPSGTVETLFKYIAPEQVPVRFGGMSIENDKDFTSADAVTETVLKPGVQEVIEIPVTEACVVALEVRVVGWEVVYGVEFVPSAEDSYTAILQKTKKVCAGEESVVKSSFKIGEAGKVVITIDNNLGKKKLLLHRFKVKSSVAEKGN